MVDSRRIEEQTELDIIKQKFEEEIHVQEQKVDFEITSKKKLVEIEIENFKKTVEAVDPKTIVEMAKAGPETQAKLLKGLGLQGYMIVDGKHTVNLMGAANGMLGK